MKKALLFLALLFLFLEVFPQRIGTGIGIGQRRRTRHMVANQAPSDTTNWYLKATGNDAYSGNSPDSAKQTLTGVILEPGDSVLYFSGDAFTTTIAATVSGTSEAPIVYTSFGTGEKPKIYGSEVISGWTNTEGNIWRASFTKNISQLFVNDTRYKLARLPNSGFYTISSVGSTSQFTSSDLGTGTNVYQNATAHIQTVLWRLEARNVTSSTDGTLNLASATTFTFGVGEKFFLNNKLEFLDEAGEWYCDTTNNYVYVWLADNANPNDFEIRGSVSDYGFDLSGKDYIVINGLNILEQKSHGINAITSDYITVTNCNIENVGGNGINMYESSSGFSHFNNFTYNTIIGTLDCGIRARTLNSEISHNTITDIAEFDAISYTEIGNGSALSIDGDESDGGDNNIRWNSLQNIAYNGIDFRGTNTLIYENFIYRVCQLLADGAGIYTYTGQDTSAIVSQGSIIRKNIVVDNNGYFDSATGKYGCNGIYLDEGTQDVLVDSNFVSTAGNAALYLHYAVNCTIRANVLNDAPIILLLDGSYADNLIEYNTLYSSDRTGTVAWWTNSNQRMVVQISGSDAAFDNNKYYSSYAKTRSFYLNGDATVNFDEWKAATGEDALSTCVYFSVYRQDEIPFYNETNLPKSFTLTGEYKDYEGNVISSPLVLEPYTGVVLLKTMPSQLQNNLVAYWKFDEITGTTADDAGANNLDGTIVNSPTLGTTGLVGTAYTLAAASSQYVSVADNDLLTLTNNCSYSFLVKPTDATTVYRPMSSKKNEMWFYLYNGKIYATLNTGGTTTYGMANTSDIAYTADEWLHIVVTVDSTATVTRQSMHIYVNGDEKPLTYTQNSGTLTVTNTTNPYLIGRQSTNSFNFDGIVDEHKIWNRKLTIKQIIEDYRNTLNGDEFTDYTAFIKSNTNLWNSFLTYNGN